MKIIVHDSSVLVDMIGCELLEPWFGSGLRAVTTRLVLHEMNRKAQRSRLQRFVDDKKLVVVGLGAEDMTGVVSLRAELSSKVSLEDASALYLAVREKGVLLTGDNDLRKAAENREIEVHASYGFLMSLSRAAECFKVSPPNALKNFVLRAHAACRSRAATRG